MMKIDSKAKIVLWGLLCMVAIPISAYGAGGQIKITQPSSFPIVIDQPGSYILTANITVAAIDSNAIEIEADNISLDLNGHFLRGPGKQSGSSGSGIYASYRNSISIKNGTIRDFGGSGIVLAGTNHQLENIRVYNNGDYGISTGFSTITNCVASYNATRGIYASNSTITGCATDSNESHGISAISSTVTNCTSSYNGSHGIYASNSTVVNCTSFGNKDRGMYATRSTIVNCTANDNDSHGIYISTGCRIEGNNVRNNGGYGLYLSSSQNYAIKNTASANTSGNFYWVSDNYMPTDGDNANYGW
jgi:parallel beta-helix repeat protein